MDRPSLPPPHSSLKSLREEVRFSDKCGNKDEPLREAGGRHVGSHPRLRSTRRSVDRYQSEDFRAATPFWRRLQNKPAQACSSSDSDFRYSVRVRAGVERYEAVATPSTGPGQATGARDPGAQSPVVRASSPQGDGGAEPVEQSGEPERRTYPFRDRTLVTINRTAEDQQVDPSVSFDSVGGLDGYLRLLKEMVFLPLVYPDLFQRFHIAPPRGVLFHGPPGTGKTLVARALASHAAASSGRRVAFFMRKGADILSKWVGEAERQLRALFDEARRHQPSIIFFDEIDGLAPVRSSKQDQIHNSIVSTLLALMDGLDARGQVVVIGATNRVDAVDGALRRPGRFDRELLFPLPALEARAEILGIHTRRWAEPPPAALLAELAAETVGYGGADLKALCTEASLAALRRRYPQVYDTQDRLVLDLQAVRVERADFQAALRGLTPASHRAAVEAVARPLPAHLAPLLRVQLDAARASVAALFPPFVRRAPGAGPSGADPPGAGPPSAPPLPMPRPRVLLCGAPRCGQGVLARALLHGAEGLALCALGLPALLADPGARGVEEALVRGLAEARRGAPAVLHLPHADAWWACAGGLARAALTHLLDDLGGEEAVLLLASAEAGWEDLDPGLAELYETDQATLRGLRMVLRDVTTRALSSRRWQAFAEPVTAEEDPDYAARVPRPMDLSTLLARVDAGRGRRIDVEVKEDEGPEGRAPTSRRSTRLTTTPGTGDASLEAIHQDPEAARRAIRQRLRQEEADRRAGADVLGKQGGAASPMQPLETPGPAQPPGAEGTDAAPPQDLVQQCDDAAYDPPVSPRRAAVAEKATARLAKLARGAPLQSLEEALAIGWQILPRIQTLPLEKRTRAMLRALRPALHGED
ncbi:ATPase family AAA domain-containing protein 2 [Auxenochlorella protothecoides]|uniref:ATPase family AAA domain-containing protein 2 n=1 Tax=Auxenochlorella protothecoides TaxID=3075 RepID=A0A087SPB9_AUXPR|nr:ATPase family AAA domain-containing protein 2 [Auxenochlorella protothecoides]KFM27573.1 ATPase family AAA domain-containing protein 2 [Auxenochlorella protothecoides]